MREENPNMDRNTRILTEDVRLPNAICEFAGFFENPSRISAVTVSTDWWTDREEQRRSGACDLMDVLESSPELRGKSFLLLHRMTIQTIGVGRVVRRKGYWGIRSKFEVSGIERGPNVLLRDEPGRLTYASVARIPAASMYECMAGNFCSSAYVWIPHEEVALTEHLVRDWYAYLDTHGTKHDDPVHRFFTAARRVVDDGGAFLRVLDGDFIYDPQQLTLFFRPDLVRFQLK
jgi:hypothetical protein